MPPTDDTGNPQGPFGNDDKPTDSKPTPVFGKGDADDANVPPELADDAPPKPISATPPAPEQTPAPPTTPPPAIPPKTDEDKNETPDKLTPAPTAPPTSTPTPGIPDSKPAEPAPPEPTTPPASPPPAIPEISTDETNPAETTTQIEGVDVINNPPAPKSGGGAPMLRRWKCNKCGTIIESFDEVDTCTKCGASSEHLVDVE